MTEHKKIIAQNKQALFNYFIEERIEAGIILKGSEVKSLRNGGASIVDSHAASNGNEILLYNCHISEYEKSNRLNHETRRPRKLLLHKQEIKRILGKIKLRGYSLVALMLYFNDKNIAKIELGLGRGKKLHDKRESIKERDWNREQSRTVRQRLTTK